MIEKKKNIFHILFLLLIFIITIYSVFKGEDLDAILDTILQIDIKYLLIGIICVVFFIWGESIIIYYMMGTLKIKIKKRFCFMYSCIGFFFSCITPSASGGQPAQIYYMNKNKIPVPIATLVLMVVTITYKSVLVFIGLFLFIFQREFIHQYLESILPIFYLGIILNIFCCLFMIILVFHPLLAKNIMINILKILVKFHILKDKPKRMKKLENSMDLYNNTAAYLKRHIKVIVNVIIITFFQRLSLFFVTYIVYLAFGLSGKHIYDIIMLQAVISVSVDMLPLPGGMGISEKLFLSIFPPIFGMKFLIPAMILSRGISYYGQLLLSACVTIFAHFKINKQISL